MLFVIEAAWKRVSSVTGAPVRESRTPYPFAHCSSKSLTTAMLNPVTLRDLIRYWRYMGDGAPI